MAQKLSLFPGSSDFAEYREEPTYYVDKTGLIADLLQNRSKVHLFTRPRRFGKTLNMSMLRYFFEIGTRPALFEGLSVSQNRDLCAQHLGKYPVLSITFSGVDGLAYAEAEQSLFSNIRFEAARLDHKYHLQQDARLSDSDRAALNAFLMGEGEGIGSLALLSRALYQVTGQKVILLIDEYDVPLQRADTCGYYDAMATTLRSLFNKGLKANPYLSFAVLTGCLRIAKESIFTGLNNVRVNSILHARGGAWFGFTQEEVSAMLAYYGLSAYAPLTKEWYNGYRFGDQAIYCPWDVILWVDQLLHERSKRPKDYWAASSGNDIIHRFAALATTDMLDDMSALLAQKTIRRPIVENLNYAELDRSPDHIWTVLLMTGYLTFTHRYEDGTCDLCLPNREIRDLFRTEIQQWMLNHAAQPGGEREQLFTALVTGNVPQAEEALNAVLPYAVSIRDTQAASGKKENFYHGLLLGLLSYSARLWGVQSNREKGDGFPDLVLDSFALKQAVILELKYADGASPEQLRRAAQAALAQIRERHYTSWYERFSYRQIHSYGIAFHGKYCHIEAPEDGAAGA